MISLLREKMGMRSLRGNLYSCADTTFGDSIAILFEVLVVTVLNGVFAFVVNEVSALFGLHVTMAANLHEGFNHPFESIDFVVPHDQAARIFVHYVHVPVFKL